MSTLNELIKTDANGEIVYNQRIEWKHFFIPNKPEWFRMLLKSIMAFFGHCLNYSALDGCYLVTRNMPEQPLHLHCHCKKKDIPLSVVKKNANAECDIRKFTEYIFADKHASKGKNQIFYDLGFDINDAFYLQREYEKQALIQYLDGNYILKDLDLRGQRLAILVTFNGKSFYSGWLLYPEGIIKNTTPFGGWVK